MPLLAAVANIGFSAVVGWYLLTKGLPAMQERFSADLKAQREDCMRALEREKESGANLAKMVTTEHHALLQRVAETAERTNRMVEDILRRLAIMPGMQGSNPGGGKP